MNKQEFAHHIADLHGITVSKSNILIDAFVESVFGALAQGESIHLVGFDSNEPKPVKERRGRHPRTGDSITIPARNTPVFKAGKRLKDAVS